MFQWVCDICGEPVEYGDLMKIGKYGVPGDIHLCLRHQPGIMAMIAQMSEAHRIGKRPVEPPIECTGTELSVHVSTSVTGFGFRWLMDWIRRK